MSEPIDAYPISVIKQQPTSSHSNGSFGPVFIVLGVIAFVSVAACVLGRFCGRRHHRSKDTHQHHQHHQNQHKPTKLQSHAGLGPKEWESRQNPSLDMRGGDVELGFDKKFKFPSASAARVGGGRDKLQPHHGGGYRPEVRFADNA